MPCVEERCKLDLLVSCSVLYKSRVNLSQLSIQSIPESIQCMREVVDGFSCMDEVNSCWVSTLKLAFRCFKGC